MPKNVPGSSKEPRVSIQAGPSEKGPPEKGLSEKDSSEKRPPEKEPPEKGSLEKAALDKGSAARRGPSEGKLTSRSGSLGGRGPSGTPAVRVVTEVEPTQRSGSLESPEAKPLQQAGPPVSHGPLEAKPLQQAGPPVSRAPLQVRPLQPALLSVNYGPSELRPMQQLAVPLSRGPSALRPFPHVVTTMGRGTSELKPMQQMGYPLSRGPSEMRPFQQAGFPLSRGPSEMRPLLQAGVSEYGPLPTKQIPFKPVEAPSRGLFTLKTAMEFANESCYSTIGLLLVCIILVTLVAIMNIQVSKLSEKSIELKDVINLQVIILAEFLRDLQVGKVYNCSICEVPWVQWGDNCYLFQRRAMSWSWSKGFCQDERSTLTVAKGTKEMDFLLYESKKYFDRQKHSNFLKFWIGLKYDTDANRWMWADGSPFDSKSHTELGQKGCAYLQNGILRSQPCTQEAFIICKAKTLFG